MKIEGKYLTHVTDNHIKCAEEVVVAYRNKVDNSSESCSIYDNAIKKYRESFLVCHAFDLVILEQERQDAR